MSAQCLVHRCANPLVSQGTSQRIATVNAVSHTGRAPSSARPHSVARTMCKPNLPAQVCCRAGSPRRFRVSCSAVHGAIVSRSEEAAPPAAGVCGDRQDDEDHHEEKRDDQRPILFLARPLRCRRVSWHHSASLRWGRFLGHQTSSVLIRSMKKPSTLFDLYLEGDDSGRGRMCGCTSAFAEGQSFAENG
jgi:hypothetical protein